MTITISLNDIEQTTCKALIAHGAKPWIAQSVARAVREAEALYNKICGLYYLESYCMQLKSGRVNGIVEPTVEKVADASIKVDAHFGFAQPAFKRGLSLAIETAKKSGNATMAICHTHTCTALGFFTRQIATEGLIAIGFTNASAVVSPPNGKYKLLGTNPIAMSIPARKGGIAMEFDQSTSAVALGKITQAHATGKSIPLGWAVDKNGNPTTDPAAALKGSLVSSGGHKGYSFGLMAEILAAAVTGGRNSSDVVALKAAEGKPHNLGQFYFLLDPTVFAGDAFWQLFDQLKNNIAKDSDARLPGSKRMWPESVELDETIWQQAKDLANNT